MTETASTGKRVLMVVPGAQFRDEEVFGAQRILEKAGLAVTIGAVTARTCRGMKGGTIEATIGLADVDAGDYDAILLAGGSSVPGEFWKDKALLALVAAIADAGKPVAALSLSTVVLARAKLLEGKRATVYYLPEALDELSGAGAVYVSDPVVVEGNIITGEGPGSVPAFTGALVELLA